MSKVIEEGYIIERTEYDSRSYIFNRPKIFWEKPDYPEWLIKYWEKNANQPKRVKNKVIKVTVTTEDI